MALALISAYAQAQKPATLNGPEVSRQTVPVRDVTPASPVRTGTPSGVTTKTLGKKSFATKIGETQNDQQTNASIYRHIHLFADGKVSVTWTTSADPAPYSSRGSGYNHFNGTSWGAVNALRIEPERCGFPNYVFNPTTNEEIITSHIVKAGTGNAGGIMMNRKTGVGPGTWTSTTVLDTIATLPGVLWNQTAISGDYMIVIASYTDSSGSQPNRVVLNGVRTPQVYSRYQFSTNTWLVKNQCLPGYDNTRIYSGGGDNYSIDANGSNVAILIGGLTDDLALWKSTDAGATWSKTIIDSFSVAAFDYRKPLDTTITNDGSVHVMLDNSGKAHCFWSRGKVVDLGDNTDNSISFYPGQNALMYWNDAMPADSFKVIGGMVDENNNGDLDVATNTTAVGARYGNNSLPTMPSAAMDDNGTIYLIYSAPTEDDISTDSKNFRDIYIVTSRDGGQTWSDVRNLTSWLGLNLEQVFGSAARRVNGKLHMTFLQKTSCGRYDATDNPGAAGTHDVMYMVLDTADIFGTVTAIGSVKNNDLFTVGQNYPNPFMNHTSIPVNFKNSTDVTVKVIDIAGKVVFESKYENMPAGASQLDLDLNNLNSGVYIYTVEAEGFKTSRRMMVD